jgi:uncharacterized protein (DUF2236 family)
MSTRPQFDEHEEKTPPETPMARLLAACARIEERIDEVDAKLRELEESLVPRIVDAMAPRLQLEAAVKLLEHRVTQLEAANDH